MLAVKAHFDGKVIVPDEPVDMPKGQALVVQIELVGKMKIMKPKKRKLTKKKKTQSALDWIIENAASDDSLPTDLAYQHDHYLYGTPKKPLPPS